MTFEANFETGCKLRTMSWSKAEKQTAKIVARIERHVAAGDYRKAKQQQRLLMRSGCGKLTAARDQNRHAKRNVRVSNSRLREIAASVNVWETCDEPVYVSPQRKRSGGFRPIFNFAGGNRTRQTLLSMALRPFLNPAPCQFQFRGGTHAAAERIKEIVEEGEQRFTQRLDIRDCYGSFTAGGISRNIPLPERVIDNAITSRHLNIRTNYNGSNNYNNNNLISRCHAPSALALRAAARRGLAQGSRLSPVVAEMLLAKAIDGFPAEAIIVNFADDILIFGRNRAECLRMTSLCVAALRQTPASPLLATRENPRRCFDSFEFLGFRFRRRQDYPIAEPSPDNLQKFKYNFWGAVLDAFNMADDEAGKLDLSPAKRFLTSWCAAFAPCGLADILNHKAYYEAQIDELALAYEIASPT